MADEANRVAGWWTSFLGVLIIALAAIAIVLASIALLTRGVAGATRERPDAVGRLQRARASVKTLGGIEIVPRTSPAATSVDGPSSGGLRLTERDGTTLQLDDDDLLRAAATTLATGTAIDSGRIARIDVLEIDDSRRTANTRITLVDGSTVDARVDPDRELEGRADPGTFDARWSAIRSIERLR